jgi:hypothetical protein
MKRLEPKKERSPIGSLKFQKKSDYKKFRNFIKKKTKELEGVTEPKDNKLKSILRVGVGGLGLLAIGALFGGKGKGKGEGGEGGNFPFAIGRKNYPDTPKAPKIYNPRKPPTQPKFVKPKSRTAKDYGKRKFTISQRGRSEAARLRQKQLVTSTGVVEGDDQVKVKRDSGNRKISKRRTIIKPKPGEVEASKKLINQKKLTQKTFGRFIKDKNFRSNISTAADMAMLDQIEREAIEAQKIRKLVEGESGTKIRDFKPTTPDERKLGEGRTVKKRYRGRIKNRDVVLRSGVRGFSKPDPFNRFGTVETPIMSKNPFKKGFMRNIFKSKITSDTIMGIPTKGKFLTKAGMFFNHPIPKGISFILTGYEAFQEGKSIVNFKDNLFTRLYDLGVAINNELIHPDDPSKMKLFISESSNDKIRKHDIMRNVKILELRKQQAEAAGGGNNVIVVPENQQNNEVKSNIPMKKGGTEVSFVPFEPLNSVGTDILLHKLNQ